MGSQAKLIREFLSIPVQSGRDYYGQPDNMVLYFTAIFSSN